MRHLDLDAAVGLGLHALGEQHGRLISRVSWRGTVAERELGGLRLCAAGGGDRGQGEQRVDESLALHSLSPDRCGVQ
jgi:hypothetical protein